MRDRIAPRLRAEPLLSSLRSCRQEPSHIRGTLRPLIRPLVALTLLGFPTFLFPSLPAIAAPLIDAGASVTERSGSFGYRAQATLGILQTGLSLGGEWAQDAFVSTYAGTARWRIGGENWGVWPLAGWRANLGGIQGPEVGLGFDIGFSPLVPSLTVEGGSVIGLDGQWAPQLRVSSRYRVLALLDLDASYRLENWASWTHVWGLGAHLVF